MVIRQEAGLKHVESVARLVQQGLHIIVQAHRVLENEGQVRDRIDDAEGARCFALAVLDIQQVLAAHQVKVTAQLGIHAVEDGRGLLFQFGCLAERTQRRAPQGINVQVPGPQGRQAQLLAAPFVDAPGSRHHHLFDGLLEGFAVFGGIVKAQKLLPAVSPVIWLVGVGSHLAAQI